MLEIVKKNIEHSEESIMFYTGLPDFLTVKDVFEIESLTENGAWIASYSMWMSFSLDGEAVVWITCQGLRISIQNLACSNV